MARIGKWTKVLMDDSGGTPRDISADVISIDGLPLAYDEIEASGFTQDHNYLAGQADAQISLEMKFTTTALTGTHTVFSGIVGSNTARTLTVQPGNNAAPTSGDPEFEGEFIVTQYTVTPAKDGMQTSTAALRIGPNATIPAWGTVS
jgi:hypothetical protein